MKIKRTCHFEINIPDALDNIERDLRKYPVDMLGIDPADMEILDCPIFWGNFWKALCEHALDMYEVAMIEGDEDFQFTSGVTFDGLEAHNSDNPFSAPNIMDLNP